MTSHACRLAAGLLTGLLLAPHLVSAAGPPPDAVAAWARHEAAAAARLDGAAATTAGVDNPEGDAIPVPGGIVHVWRGSVLVRGVSLDTVLDVLMHPGTPPPQEDVLESRVLARSGTSLQVYIKLERRSIVTVRYETEHDVLFRRDSPVLATSRSRARRISEIGGGDHGFLWRLSSFWRYRQLAGDVLIDVESLSLSRDIPFLVRPIAAPLIGRIGRESMGRTLTAVKNYIEGRAGSGGATPAASRRQGRAGAGSCCVRQCSVPRPQTRSTAWIPTTTREGSTLASVSSATRSFGSLNVGTITTPLAM